MGDFFMIIHHLPPSPIIITVAAILLRLSMGLWGYSGEGKPPMFGDFEAQRHWMEVTRWLPIGEWYRAGPYNDLMYWGLDYPPLTAYVSFLFGLLATFFYPELVALETSRGVESVEAKAFMRGSVLLCDMIVLIPSLFLITAISSKIAAAQRHIHWFNFAIGLSCPSLILIDHGHFQYNGVCIGLALLSASCVLIDHDIVGSILFCLSLNFKQMSLYYAPVFFCILLRKCFLKPSVIGGIIHLGKLGVTVMLTFSVLWAPFCVFRSANETCLSSLLHVLARIFPFNRGIFEDKVANLWYSASVFIDYRNYVELDAILKFSLLLTLALLTPVMVNLLLYPITGNRLLLALTNSALAFFLASFQVHEKSLLLALVPSVCLVYRDPLLLGWFQVFGTFTMFPLLVRDGLRIPYFALLIIFTSLLLQFSTEPPAIVSDKLGNTNLPPSPRIIKIKEIFIFSSIAGIVILHVAEALITPPTRYPDIYPALFALFGSFNLVLMYLYGVLWQWSSTIQLEYCHMTNKKVI